MSANKLKRKIGKILKDIMLEAEELEIIDIGAMDTEQSAEGLKHSKNYSKLLDIYVKSTKTNVRMKNVYKFFFFVITMFLLIGIVYVFYKALNYSFDFFAAIKDIEKISLEAILSVVTIITPAVLSLIVAFIEIPKIIAQYLFNVKEDSFMNSVIKNIQDYDKSMYQLEHSVEELVEMQKKNDEVLDDEIIEDIPHKLEDILNEEGA